MGFIASLTQRIIGVARKLGHCQPPGSKPTLYIRRLCSTFVSLDLHRVEVAKAGSVLKDPCCVARS